jgi:hypothetical protein
MGLGLANIHTKKAAINTPKRASQILLGHLIGMVRYILVKN